MASDKLKFIAHEDIWWDNRFRTDLGNIEELADSIREKGLIQPVTVAPIVSDKGEHYKLLAGERRWTASAMAGLKKIPALVRETEDEVDEREIELVENVHRKDMNWQERAALVGRLHDLCEAKQEDWSARKTAHLLGESHHMGVQRALQLRDALTVAPELAECRTQDEALKAIKKISEGVVTKELRHRQQEAIAKGHKPFLKLAETKTSSAP